MAAARTAARQAPWAGPGAAAAVTAAALSALLLTAEPALASNTAAQISLDSLPPNSISVQIQDLPYVLYFSSVCEVRPITNPSLFARFAVWWGACSRERTPR
jgi:hypothetical protein